MKSIGAIAAALLLAAWIGLLPAKAQDPGSAPVQTGIEALFVIDEAAQHVTLYVRGLFRPLPGPVLWAVPLPAPPAEAAWLRGADTAFSILDEDTQPVIEAPFPGACALAPQLVFGDGYLPWPWISEAIGHDDDADATPLILPDPDALRAHAGQVAAPLAVSEAALAALPAGWVYAALPVAPGPLLQDDFWASHFVEATPVLRAVFPYDGPEALAALLALPLAWRAAALEAVLINDLRPDALTVTVYIAAGTAYALADAPLAAVDLKAVPGGYDWIAHILTDVVGPEFFFGSLRPGYDALVVEALAVDPPSFVREFVGPPALSTGIPTLADRPDARRILDQVDAQPVLTRLYALYPVDRPDVRAYPVIRFAPDPSAVPGHLDYTAAVDPAWFFTCTTRRLDDPALAARLPAGRTRIDALRLDVAHPLGWTLTTVAPPAGTSQSAPIYVLAPADAPPDHLARLEAGAADGPPALAMQAFAGPYVAGDEYSLAPPDPSERPFTHAADAALPPGIARLSAVRYFPTARADDSHDVPFAEGVRIALIGPAADLAANRSLYQAMLDHLLRYPYLLDPALRHTLFEGDLRTLIALGYPEDWLEVIVDGARWILPRAALGLPADAPVGDTRGLIPVTDRTPWVRLHRFRNADDLAALLARFGLAETALDEARGRSVPFAHDGRSGFIRVQVESFSPAYLYGTVVEVSAPADDIASAELVGTMAAAVHLNGIDRWLEGP